MVYKKKEKTKKIIALRTKSCLTWAVSFICRCKSDLLARISFERGRIWDYIFAGSRGIREVVRDEVRWF